MSTTQVPTAAGEMRVELHSLNNALAAALGRIEICEDGLVQPIPVDVAVLRECLQEAQHAILRARDHVIGIAEIGFSTAG